MGRNLVIEKEIQYPVHRLRVGLKKPSRKLLEPTSGLCFEPYVAKGFQSILFKLSVCRKFSPVYRGFEPICRKKEASQSNYYGS